MLYMTKGSKDLSNVFTDDITICNNDGLGQKSVIHKKTYMSVHVLLNLLNELSKRDKMRGLREEELGAFLIVVVGGGGGGDDDDVVVVFQVCARVCVDKLTAPISVRDTRTKV